MELQFVSKSIQETLLPHSINILNNVFIRYKDENTQNVPPEVTQCNLSSARFIETVKFNIQFKRMLKYSKFVDKIAHVQLFGLSINKLEDQDKSNENVV